MKRNKMVRIICFGLCAILSMNLMTGCGDKQQDETSTGNKKYDEFLTVDVYDSQANFQGIQNGWFAKVVKDKFNMELNIISRNVADVGDTMYQARSANGNLGDLIITNADSGRLNELVSAALVLDMSPYMDDCENLNRYTEAIADMEKVAGIDGVYAIPSEISNQPATEPCDVLEPTNAPSIRWDIYEKIGCPKMDTLEDLLDVMEAMQEAAGKSDSGKDVYAFSLFKDWDGDNMQNAGAICALYGYEPQGFCMAKDDGSEIQSVLDEDGIYVKALKFLYEANQRGLIDPESQIQTFDDLTTKYQDGAILYSLWPWLGSGQYNSATNTELGKGFATATIGDMKCVTYGSMPKGKMSNAIMVGSKTKDPQRLVDFIDWLYSPEGIEMSAAESGGSCGPKGLTWDMDENGQPYLTDFGVKAFIERQSDLEVPKEWGEGTWIEGISALNYKAVGVVDVDEETGICYNYQRWDDYQERTATKLSKDWSAVNGNANSALTYLKDHEMLLVRPGSNYATPECPSDIQTLKDHCKQVIISGSWEMIFAKDETEFYSILKKIQKTVSGLGYEKVLAVDEQNCRNLFTSFQAFSDTPQD